jgi:PAS domain S-box-containing protein
MKNKKKPSPTRVPPAGIYLNEFIESVDVPFVAWGPDLKITRFNPACERITGYPASQAVGKPLGMFLSEACRDGAMSMIAEALKSGTWKPMEIRLTRKDGGTWPLVWNFFNISAPDGATPVEIIALGKDLSACKEAETALEAEKNRFNGLFENMRGAIAIYEPVDGGLNFKFISVNRGMERIDGISRAKLLGRLVTEAFPGIEEFGLLDVFRRVWKTGKSELFPTKLYKDDRIHGWRENFVYKLPSGEIVALYDDLSRNKQEEAALRESEERYRAVSEYSNNAICIIDDRAKIIWGNTQMTALGGHSLEAIYAAGSFAEFIAPESAEFVASNFRKVLAGEPYEHHYVFYLVRSDGEKRLCEKYMSDYRDKNGRIKLVISMLDITERTKAAADISENYEIQTLLNLMLQQSLSNTSLRSKLDDHLSKVLAASWMPVGPKGAIFLMDGGGRNLVLMVHKGLAPVLLTSCAKVPVGKCMCGKAAESGRAVASECVGPEHEIMYEGMAPHGHYCVPIRAGTRTMGVMCLYLREHTRLTVKQESFIGSVAGIIAANVVHSQVEEHLIQSQKMESIGRLAGGVAHDFNNLVTAINGYAQILLNGLPPEDARRADVQEILAAGDRAAGLTRQLLAFSRKQVLKPVVLDLNSAVQGVSKMLGRLIGEHIALEVKTVPGPCLARLDPGQLDQVLINLAVNARDAMPKGGKLCIKTEITDMPQAWRARKTHLKPGPLLRLSVTDTGTGMSSEVKEKLFEPFFSTKEVGRGTGLGLATVYGIVMQSGGEIEVESSIGQGSTFIIYFPMLSEGETARPVDKNEPLSGGKETVLFVEDEEALLKLGNRILNGLGYTVLTASNGSDALRILSGRAAPVDLIITDMLMPGMSGVELARQAAAQCPGIKILYVSGYTQDAVAMEYVGISNRAFIQKPYSPDSLLLKVRLVLDAPAQRSRP